MIKLSSELRAVKDFVDACDYVGVDPGVMYKVAQTNMLGEGDAPIGQTSRGPEDVHAQGYDSPPQPLKDQMQATIDADIPKQPSALEGLTAKLQGLKAKGEGYAKAHGRRTTAGGAAAGGVAGASVAALLTQKIKDRKKRAIIAALSGAAGAGLGGLGGYKYHKRLGG